VGDEDKQDIDRMNDMNKNVILNQRFEKAEAAKFKFQRQR